MVCWPLLKMMPLSGGSPLCCWLPFNPGGVCVFLVVAPVFPLWKAVPSYVPVLYGAQWTVTLGSDEHARLVCSPFSKCRHLPYFPVLNSQKRTLTGSLPPLSPCLHQHPCCASTPVTVEEAPMLLAVDSLRVPLSPQQLRGSVENLHTRLVSDCKCLLWKPNWIHWLLTVNRKKSWSLFCHVYIKEQNFKY